MFFSLPRLVSNVPQPPLQRGKERAQRLLLLPLLLRFRLRHCLLLLVLPSFSSVSPGAGRDARDDEAPPGPRQRLPGPFRQSLDGGALRGALRGAGYGLEPGPHGLGPRERQLPPGPRRRGGRAGPCGGRRLRPASPRFRLGRRPLGLGDGLRRRQGASAFHRAAAILERVVLFVDKGSDELGGGRRRARGERGRGRGAPRRAEGAEVELGERDDEEEKSRRGEEE